MARNPQFGQREQGGDLRRIILESLLVVGLQITKLALIHPKRTLDLGTNRDLEFLDVARPTANRVHRDRLRVGANVDLHAEIHLRALLI